VTPDFGGRHILPAAVQLTELCRWDFRWPCVGMPSDFDLQGHGPEVSQVAKGVDHGADALPGAPVWLLPSGSDQLGRPGRSSESKRMIASCIRSPAVRAACRPGDLIERKPGGQTDRAGCLTAGMRSSAAWVEEAAAEGAALVIPLAMVALGHPHHPAVTLDEDDSPPPRARTPKHGTSPSKERRT